MRALRTHKPPALRDTHKYAARRGAPTPPQRAVGEGADADGGLPSDKGDCYVALDGTSHRPERWADHTELAEMPAGFEHTRAQVRALRDKAWARALEQRRSDLFDEMESDADDTEHHELSIIGAALAAAAARQQGRPGDVGDPAANPVHHPSSGRVNQPRAAEQSAPPRAAACTAGRETDGPLYGAAAPGGGGRLHLHPEAGPRRAPSAPLGLQCHPSGTPPRDNLNVHAQLVPRQGSSSVQDSLQAAGWVHTREHSTTAARSEAATMATARRTVCGAAHAAW